MKTTDKRIPTTETDPNLVIASLRKKLTEAHKDRQAYADQQVKAEDWISSSERIPENNEEVLCFNGFRMIQNSYSIGSDQDQAWFKRTFSHWKKLPERPKIKQP